MLDIIITRKDNIDVVDSLLLHKALKVKSHHRNWITRRIEEYGFQEKIDYFRPKVGVIKKVGRPSKSVLITIDMAKELAMLENNEIGKATRRYFIKCEKQLRKHEAIKLASMETRKTLTEKIQESGENERMHGHGYSTYTKLIYSLTGLTGIYKEWKLDYPEGKVQFRDYIQTEQLRRIEQAEALIKPLLELEKQYSEIKDTLEPVFKHESTKSRIGDGK